MAFMYGFLGELHEVLHVNIQALYYKYRQQYPFKRKILTHYGILLQYSNNSFYVSKTAFLEMVFGFKPIFFPPQIIIVCTVVQAYIFRLYMCKILHALYKASSD